MLTASIVKTMGAVREGAMSVRNIGIVAPTMSKASDPIQQLFIDKIRAYKPGKIEPNSPAGRMLASELEKLARRYNISSPEASGQLPPLKWEEPNIDITSGAVVKK